MKTLDVAAVVDTAKDLISKNGQTTNLEIKKALRANGYYATQSEVADIMNSVYSSSNLEFTYNGTFREYFESNQVVSASTIISVTSLTSKSSKTPRPHIPAVEVGHPLKGDWFVFDANDNDDFKYYAAGPSRGTVRSAFHKISRVDYLDTRARRVK
jgi:hypothetical protein